MPRGLARGSNSGSPKFPGTGHSLLAGSPPPPVPPPPTAPPARRSKRLFKPLSDDEQDVKPALHAPATPIVKIEYSSASYPTPVTTSPTASTSRLPAQVPPSPTRPKPKRARKVAKAESGPADEAEAAGAVAGPSQASPGSCRPAGGEAFVPTGPTLYTLVDDDEHKPLGWDGRLVDPAGQVQVRATPIVAGAKAEGEEGKPGVGEGEEDYKLPPMAMPEKIIIPPDTRPGRSVKWDPLVRTLNTGATKTIYRLDPAYLAPLDVEHTRNADGWPMRLYSEQQVQQAAYDQRGGRAHFQAYIQDLHNAARGRAMRNTGEDLPELSLSEPPLGECPYFWAEVTEPGHEDRTREPEVEPQSTQTVPDSDPPLQLLENEEIKPARVTRATSAPDASDAEATTSKSKKVKFTSSKVPAKGKGKAGDAGGGAGKAKPTKGKGQAKGGAELKTPVRPAAVKKTTLTPAEPTQKASEPELATPTQSGLVGLDELGELELPAGFAPEKVVVPPGEMKGQKVWFDRNVRVIKTGNAKKIYELDDKYLKPLRRTETAGVDGWDLTLYCEREVQQAAWDMRGGRAFFSEYIQKLHNQAVARANSKGLPPPPELDLDQPPLGECPYYEDGTPPDHVDETVVSKGGDTHLDKWDGFRSSHYLGY